MTLSCEHRLHSVGCTPPFRLERRLTRSRISALSLSRFVIGPRFAEEKGLTEHLPILKKGALLAQNPHDYDHISELTVEDREAIDY